MADDLRLTSFEFEGKSLQISFKSRDEVAPGVVCETYSFVGDKTKDLGVIFIEPGSKTPLQKVLKGKRTEEGYISGKGVLRVTNPGAEPKIYPVGGSETDKPFSIDVEIGQLMQWEAAPDSKLVAYEICFPPYEPGRYENID